jgi:hypothetical protein
MDRRYGAVRGVLITLGILAYTLATSRRGAASAASGAGGASAMVVAGIVVQLLLIGAHALIRRRVADPGAAARVHFVVELAGDGVTVLLFALGVLGGVMRAAYGF